ncbi:MAG: response regulator [Lentisphaerae bacterium]|nr:response regulator [Lentisphaerota bacterium]
MNGWKDAREGQSGPSGAGADKSCVLVVDDEERNRRLLADILGARGYRVLQAKDGEEALACILQDAPDLVLLDVMMPKLDGYEVCRRVKSNSKSASTPVLLVTALGGRSDRLRGIEAGADEFITKPMDTEEVILRVRNAVHMKRLHDQTREDLRQIRVLEHMRDNLVHMVVHDLRSPLTAIQGYMELLRDAEGPRLSEAGRNYLREANVATGTLIAMISSILDVSKIESGAMKLTLAACDMEHLLRDVERKALPLKGCTSLLMEPCEQSFQVMIDAVLISRVLENLVGNALKFVPETGGEVVLRLVPRGAGVCVQVRDNGPGIPAEDQGRIFDKFAQVDQQPQRYRYSSGLGLTFCKMAIEAHGGCIGVESTLGEGSTFWFTLPTC